MAKADQALAIHGDDAAVRKLKLELEAEQTVLAQRAERERQFGMATNAAWAAYRAGNWTNAMAKADQALAIHGDDAAVRKLKLELEAKQTALAQQAEQERQFGVATNAAWAAYRAGNLTNAIAEVHNALAIRGDDAGMKKLKAEAVARLAAKANEQQPGTPPPTNNVPSPIQPELSKLDTTLATYEVLFRLKPPAPNIVDKNGSQVKQLPLTLIPLDQKGAILKMLKGLESGYQAGGWLQEREQRLQNLRQKIKNW
jgi:tetratricopeptide (TPR) repeat protein